jgi:hypothetical protein
MRECRAGGGIRRGIARVKGGTYATVDARALHTRAAHAQ